jgi:Gas vesicle protein
MTAGRLPAARRGMPATTGVRHARPVRASAPSPGRPDTPAGFPGSPVPSPGLPAGAQGSPGMAVSSRGSPASFPGSPASSPGHLSPPSRPRAIRHQQIALVDLLDRVLATGVVIVGDVTLSIADVDLVTISLRALVSSAGPDLVPGLDEKSPDR